MDPFGDSDLSDISAPPTPGPVSTPRAASPDPLAEPAHQSSSDPADAAPKPAGRSAAQRRSSARVTDTPTATPSTPSSSRRPKATKKAPGDFEPADDAEASASGTPSLNRKASTRNRQVPAKLRSPSPLADRADKPSPAGRAARKTDAGADTSKARIKVKLSVKKASGDGRAAGDSGGSSRASTPQSVASASGTKVTIKPRGKKNKLADELRDLADDDTEAQSGSAPAEDAAPGDDFLPDAQAVNGDGLGGARRQSTGKRGRDSRNKAGGRRRAVVADDEDEEEGAGKGADEAPQRKRAKLADSTADGGRADGRRARKTKKAIDYSDDDDDVDEEMVDAASDEDDLELDAAAADDSEDDFEQDGAASRRGGANSKTARGAKSAGRQGASVAGGSKGKAPASSGLKKAGAATASTAAGKGMSAEARMRASIDAAKDKSLKPPGVASAGTKLNPLASAFRPSGAIKSGTSTPTGAAGGSAPKRPASTGKPAFGKSMSGWDQLFGGISGLSSSASTPSKATPTKPGAASKPATPTAAVSGSGIRQDPVLEAASPAEVQRFKEQANQQYLNTDECFDLLAHADIMTAFERSIGIEDRKLAARLRPCVYRAGQVLLPKHQQATQPTQSAP